MIVPSASVTAAWNVTPFTVRPAKFRRTLWLGWNSTTLSMARRARWNKRAKHRRVAHPTQNGSLQGDSPTWTDSCRTDAVARFSLHSKLLNNHHATSGKIAEEARQ